MKGIGARHARGMSLVELMVAVTLGLILIAGLLQVYLSTRTAYSIQDAVMRRQENLRYVTYVLTRDVRMAGYRGCLRDTGNVINTLNTPANFLYNFALPVQGFEATSSAGAGTWSPALDATISNVVPGTDVVTVRSITDPDVYVTQAMPTSSADVKTNPLNPYPFQIGEIVLISDCGGSAIFQITNLSTLGAFGNVVHNTGGAAVPGNATQNLGRRYPEGSQLMRIRTVSYFIRNSARGTGPALWRRVGSDPPEEMAEGVENMQALYGEDTDNDQVPDAWRKASAVTQWRNVTAVRIGLLVAGPANNAGEPDSRSFVVLDENLGARNDRRVRSVLTTTVALRNRLP